jgi:drug/metabolite transporter (DMT)-like permease
MNPKLGITLKICAMFCATLMLACVKGLNGQVPIGQVVFFRSFVAMLPLFVWLSIQGHMLASLHTRKLSRHLVRGMSGTGGMFFNYLALTYIPLADATALSYAAPLFTVILAALLLGEVVRFYRWSAVAIGFAGVLFMLSPHLRIEGRAMDGLAMMGGASALVAALCSAISNVQIRHLNDKEHPGAIVFYFSLLTTAIGLATAVFGWVRPDAMQLFLLIGCGLFGGLAQILITLSLRYSHASLLAPFDYTTLIWSVIIGFVLMREVPAVETLAGAVLVIGAGLFVFWREKRAASGHRISTGSA